MNSRQLVAAAAVLGCTVASAGPGDEASRLLDVLRHAQPGTTFTSIAPTDLPGIFEVWMGQNVAYVAASNPRYFIFGRVIDTQTLTDITGPRIAQAQARIETSVSDTGVGRIAIDTLPTADALKTVHGQGTRVIYAFSDPACGYCRRLEPELAKLRDVTVYTFVLPFLGRQLPESILCADDPARRWHAWMMDRDAAGLGPQSCASSLDRNLALAQRLGVTGTPTVFYADGSRTSGYVGAEELERRLAQASTVSPVARRE